MDERIYVLEELYKYLQKGCLKNNVHNKSEIYYCNLYFAFKFIKKLVKKKLK